MVYAMMSIGVLGFVVWSQRVAFPVGDNWVINFAICWNSLVPMDTFNSQNFMGYAQSAGNVLSYLITCTLADLNDPVALLCLVPVISYSNADTKKEQILRENKEKSGIYIWTNLKNGQRYIGCSQNLRKRFWQYYNINYLTDNKGMIICRALLKYGYSSFSLAILEYCKVEDLFEREEYYFKSLGPEYNVCKEAGKPRNTSGLEVSSETRAKISVARLNNPQAICKQIEVTDLQTGISTAYSSINLAGKALNIPHTSIIYNVNSKTQKPYKGRYVVIW